MYFHSSYVLAAEPLYPTPHTHDLLSGLFGCLGFVLKPFLMPGLSQTMYGSVKTAQTLVRFCGLRHDLRFRDNRA